MKFFLDFHSLFNKVSFFNIIMCGDSNLALWNGHHSFEFEGLTLIFGQLSKRIQNGQKKLPRNIQK